jgi:hypothetical protein
MEFAGRASREPCAYETLHLGPRKKTDRRVRLTAEGEGVVIMDWEVLELAAGRTTCPAVVVLCSHISAVCAAPLLLIEIW